MKCRVTTSIAYLCLLLALQNSSTTAFNTKKGNAPSLSAVERKQVMCFSKEDKEGSEDDDKIKLQTWNPLRLAVLKLGFTEPMWTSPLNYGKKDGKFACAYCGHELFDSDGKYDSGSGWPSFWRSIDEGAISYKMEFDGRLECRCGRCSSHLGHVFLDGPRPDDVSQNLLSTSPESDPRSKRDGARLPRFCVNGASLSYQKSE